MIVFVLGSTICWPCIDHAVDKCIKGFMEWLEMSEEEATEKVEKVHTTNIYLTLSNVVFYEELCAHTYMYVSIQAQTDNTVMREKLIVINTCYQDWVVANKAVEYTEAQIEKLSKRLIGRLHIR